MYRIISLLGVMFLLGQMFAQSREVIATKHPLLFVPKTSTVNPLDRQPDWYPQMRNTDRLHQPHPAQKAIYQSRLEEIGSEGQSVGSQSITPNLRTSTSSSPLRYSGFPANVRDTGNPNDNDIAISKDGARIISVVNLDISAYDSAGSELFSKSLQAFSPDVGNNQKFDPRILYDPLHDRFIFVCLNGFNPTTTRVVLAFSSTNRPEDPWYVYGLNANVELITGVDVWADFPHIGITREELFVSVNLFNADNEGQGTGVWQIGLESGYSGEDLVVQTHSLQGTFSISPVHGAVEPYGPNMYFVDNVSLGADNRIFLHEISNTIAENGQFNTVLTFTDQSYRLSPGGRQKDVPIILMAGDCRIHSAYKIDNRIYFGFNARAGGKAGIYFGTLKLSPIAPTFSSLDSELLFDDRFDMAYPSLAWGGCRNARGTQHATMMMVNISAPDTFPGNAVYQIDTLGDLSEPTVCGLGNRYLGRLENNPDSVWRWGDYTGISSPTPGEVWVAGYTVTGAGRNQTIVSRVFNPDCAEIPQPPLPPLIEETRVIPFPNPVNGMLNFKVEIATSAMYRATIIDPTGRRIHTLIEGQLEAGTAEVSFNTEPLAAGIYILLLESNGDRVLYEKFVVE